MEGCNLLTILSYQSSFESGGLNGHWAGHNSQALLAMVGISAGSETGCYILKSNSLCGSGLKWLQVVECGQGNACASRETNISTH